jgi:hypothetical protein
MLRMVWEIEGLPSRQAGQARNDGFEINYRIRLKNFTANLSGNSYLEIGLLLWLLTS